MINILKLIPEDGHQLAAIVLAQAGIGPLNVKEAEIDDQYEIEYWGIDVDKIVIVNRGVTHGLKVSVLK